MLRDDHGAGASSSCLLLSSLQFSDTKVYTPEMRALLKTASHFCKVALKSRTAPNGTTLGSRIIRVIRLLNLFYSTVAGRRGDRVAVRDPRYPSLGAPRAAGYDPPTKGYGHPLQCQKLTG